MLDKIKAASDILDLPDDEFLENFNEFAQPKELIDEPDEEVEEEESEDVDEDEDDEEEVEEEDDEDDEESDEDSEEDEEESEDEDEESEGDDDDEGESEDDSDSDDVLKEALAPLKAMGREVKIESIEELRRLASMGIGFNSKMRGIKPHIKVLRTLEQANMLDPEKINFAIDLVNKKPEAIAKLVKDAELDPLDIDVESSKDYKPSNHTVDDSTIALEDALEEIQQTPTYNTTISIVVDKWDEKSRAEIAKDPRLIKVINDHVATGVYEKINAEVERQRLLGKLDDGVSDIDAYYQIGTQLFNNSGDGNGEAEANQSQNNRNKSKPNRTSNNDEIRNKKKAAKPTKASSKSKPNKKQSDFNPLDLPDDEFEKLMSKYSF